MGLTLTEYKRTLRKLLPRGKAWEFATGSQFLAFLESFATELKRVDDSGEGLAVDILPNLTTNFITEWEKILGLYETNYGKTDSERRNEIIYKLNFQVEGGKKFYEDLGTALGFPITITEFNPFTAGDFAGDLLTNGDWPFTFVVTFSGDPSNDKTAFYNFLLTIKPANTIAMIDYSGLLIFDDRTAAQFDDGAYISFT